MLLMFNIVACVALGAMRLLGVTSVVFQAIAHVYVGGLFVYGWQPVPQTVMLTSNCNATLITKNRHWFLWLAIALTVVEVFAAVAFKHGLLTK